tara:strand:+ start:4075 stop:5277 length:1203 start_codon:yes stop_codon:yes gene_type:complete
MKYLVIIGNGLTDQPIAHKNNLTILQLAETPHMDRLAQMGQTGSVKTVPDSLPPGNDISFLSWLGFDPERHHAGAAGFEVISLGVEPQPGWIPLCCDFVILQSSHTDMVMKDYTANQLSDNNARELLKALEDQVVDTEVSFYPGAGYHNLMTIRNDPFPDRLLPPDDLIGEGVRDRMPSGPLAKKLVLVMNQAQIILHNHHFNRKRREEGMDPINSVWFWGNGDKPSLPSFTEKYTFNAGVVTASSLLRGMAMNAGMKVVPVKGVTGFMDTDYSAKVSAAVSAMEKLDLVYLQVTAPERPSMQGLVEDKILAVEDFDREVVGPILEHFAGQNDVKIMLAVNQMCSANLMRFTRDAVPFVVYPAVKGADAINKFNEDILTSGTKHFASGPDLMSSWFKAEL